MAVASGGELRPALSALLASQPPRAGSLAITIFGDCISQQGGSVWLRSLVEVMAAFGLNPRQVRTAVFRLGQDGWLDSEQIGRRSYYRFSESGRRQFMRAATRIYAAVPPPWDGRWTLVMPGALAAPEREELRRRLGWLGFGALTSGVLAHPAADREGLAETLVELGLGARVMVWEARTTQDELLRSLSEEAWQLADLADRFSRFITTFAPLCEAVERDGTPDDASAFVLRTMLVHEYRRILLRTTALPPALLPKDWPGHTAMALVRDAYALLHGAASRHASAALSNADGPLPAPGETFQARFGGLAAARCAVA